MIFRMWKPGLAGFAASLLFSATLFAAEAKAPQPPDETSLAAVREKIAQLGAAIEKLRAKEVYDKLLVDVEVFHKAGVFQLQHNQWYAPDDAKRTLAVLDRGLARAQELEGGKAPWRTRPGSAIRAYRSTIDGSVQPYAVVLPEGYPGAGAKQWRLDVILHGRDDQLTETKFIAAHDFDKPAPKQDYVELHVFGRTCNAYRWAGERDVFEALDSLQHAEIGLPVGSGVSEHLDPNRIVLRGFSMGGAGAWHLGLHFPATWCSVSPGAGFSSTFGPVKNKEGKLPAYEEKCLSIYESLDYAENVLDVPFVAYGGEDDPQLEAARAIEAKLKPLGIPLTLLIGPKTQHKYHPESLKEIMQLQGAHAAAGRPAYPAKIHFVTWYPNYHDCHWIVVLEMDHMYQRSSVTAEFKDDKFVVSTENINSLLIVLPPSLWNASSIPITVNGQALAGDVVEIPDRGCFTILMKRPDQKWESGKLADFRQRDTRSQRKFAGSCGPIDDAFTQPFLCVRGTGKPWNEKAQKYAEASLARFEYEWSRYFRGDVPIKDDRDVTDADRASKNLILFGDGGSNAEIAARLKAGLGELQWTKDAITFGGKSYASADNVPVMIFPAPIKTLPSPSRYIVLNSGHTFHEPDFKTTNRMLYPRLGDYAILKPAPTQEDPCAATVVTAGLFDETWKIPKQP